MKMHKVLRRTVWFPLLVLTWGGLAYGAMAVFPASAMAVFPASAGAVFPASAGADTITARQKELLYVLDQDCGSCHGSTLKGGLGPSLLPDNLQGKNARELAEIILDGVPNTPMPPWRPLMSEKEALWLAQVLKAGSRKQLWSLQ